MKKWRSHLKNFPIGKLKIDKSFVQRLAENPRDRAIVGHGHPCSQSGVGHQRRRPVEAP
jgi:hypothetical protein